MNFNKILENKENTFNSKGENVHIDSLMIYDNGQHFEHFFKPDGLHEMRSISKLFIALAYGIAIDRGMISLDEKVYPLLKGLVDISTQGNLEKIKEWKIEHLLTYTCGYAEQMFSEEFIKNIKDNNHLNYVLNYPITMRGGEKYTYNNADIFLLSVYFQEKFNENIKDFIVREIFKPLGIEEYIWENYGKYCPAGTGLYISHHDLFKVGLLILNKGNYEGKQLISKKYIEKMCSCRLKTPYAVKPERVLPKEGVGYVMHISRDGYSFKDGTNGQYLIVNFKKKQLITILASESEMSYVTEILRGEI